MFWRTAAFILRERRIISNSSLRHFSSMRSRSVTFSHSRMRCFTSSRRGRLPAAMFTYSSGSEHLSMRAMLSLDILFSEDVMSRMMSRAVRKYASSKVRSPCTGFISSASARKHSSNENLRTRTRHSPSASMRMLSEGRRVICFIFTTVPTRQISPSVISSFSESGCAHTKRRMPPSAARLIAASEMSLPASNETTVSGNMTLPRMGTTGISSKYFTDMAIFSLTKTGESKAPLPKAALPL